MFPSLKYIVDMFQYYDHTVSVTTLYLQLHVQLLKEVLLAFCLFLRESQQEP